MGYVENVLESRGKYKEIKELFNGDLSELDSLIMPVDTNISIDSVILSDENKMKIDSLLVEQNHRDELIAHKLYPMNRVLMYGASGTGKTYLTKALSNYMGYTMLYVDIAKSLSEGSISINISNIFKLSNALGDCILFFDEVDAIAWNRDSSSPDSGTIRRATNSLFQQLDQMVPSNIFVSATNLLYRLDVAFERRFNIKMQFLRPNNLESAIERFMYPEFKLIKDMGSVKKEIITNRALASPKLSYYEIENMVKKAMKRAIISKTNFEVKESWIYNDLAIAENIRVHIKDDE